jgi:hypothetical protein
MTNAFCFPPCFLFLFFLLFSFDRLLCSSYLEFYMREELLDEMEMFPFNESFPDERFRSPPVLPYDQYFDYIDAELGAESPVAFGLHPNAEIAVKTKQAADLFTYILDLQPRSSAAAAGDSVQSPQAIVQMLIQQVVNDKAKGIEGINFNLDDIAGAVVDDRGPFQNVFLLECERMNILCREMRRSRSLLDLGRRQLGLLQSLNQRHVAEDVVGRVGQALQQLVLQVRQRHHVVVDGADQRRALLLQLGLLLVHHQRKELLLQTVLSHNEVN